MSETSEALPTVDFQRRRTIALRISFALLVFLPFVNGMLTSLAAWAVSNFFFYDGISNTALSLVYYFDASLWTISAYQILIWWQWKPHAKPRWPVGLGLLLAAVIGTLVAEQVGSVFYTWFDKFWELTAMYAAMTSSHLAVDYVMLAAAGSLVQFRFFDRRVVTGEEGVDENAVKRTAWSVRDFFTATLVAAVLLACLKWSRSIYEDNIDIDSYPASDASLAIYHLSASAGNVLCILAAANRYVTRSIAPSLFMLTCAVAVDLAGLFIWLWMLPNDEWTLETSYVLGPVVHVVVVYWVTRWLLRRWEAAGYSLRRSKSLVSN